METREPNPSIWSRARRPRTVGEQPEQVATGDDLRLVEDQADPDSSGHRSVFQHDYDRLLFSTPVRRLADKTQVWPMDENDGVRTRLTHSHEVANLARSIGTRAYNSLSRHLVDHDGVLSLGDTVQPMLLSIGLGHDLGNPPFGHQGEAAISRWFKDRDAWIFTHVDKHRITPCQPVDENLRAEFKEFDGNPQSLRLLTKNAFQNPCTTRTL